MHNVSVRSSFLAASVGLDTLHTLSSFVSLLSVPISFLSISITTFLILEEVSTLIISHDPWFAMLSYLGTAAEFAHCQDCKQITNSNLASHVCSTFCPIAHSMNYIASALSPRPTSAKSMLSFPSTQSSILEETTPEELSEEDHPTNDTRATSIATESRRKRTSTSSVKRAPKSVFHLAHPPPVSIHKQHLHIRPRVLLQLQKVSETARPAPVLEVLPSFVFASRLARRFPRTFKGKAGLGADDLVIVNSEDYKAEGSENGELDGIFEGDRWDKREIVAAICQPARDELASPGKAEICLSNGSTWTASRLASGHYEFTSIDEHGLQSVARWVSQQPKSTQQSLNAGRGRSSSEEKKFNFSLLNPNSRRHAVIACLDRHSIEVSSKYSHPPTPLQGTAASTPTTSVSATSVDYAPKDSVEVSPALRSLILVTGIFVSFQEGFSSLFKAGDSTPTSPNLGSKHQRRTLSLNGSQFSGDQLMSPTSPKLGTVVGSRARLQHTSSSSAVPLASSNSQMRRTTSSGGAFMQRIRSRNNTAIKANQLSPVSGDGESEVERMRTTTGKDNDQVSSVSSLYSETTTAGIEENLDTIAKGGLGIVEERTLAGPIVTKKSSRLSKIFGLSRRTGRES